MADFITSVIIALALIYLGAWLWEKSPPVNLGESKKHFDWYSLIGGLCIIAGLIIIIPVILS